MISSLGSSPSKEVKCTCDLCTSGSIQEIDKIQDEKANQNTQRMKNVNSPDHYTAGGIETIDFIEAKCLGYHLGNAIKYISRAGKKGDMVEDLEKAIWYIKRYIQEEC